jgi:hypothetical protein
MEYRLRRAANIVGCSTAEFPALRARWRVRRLYRFLDITDPEAHAGECWVQSSKKWIVASGIAHDFNNLLASSPTPGN